MDFGTTNSAAAVYDGSQLTLVALEGNSPIMPSATYIDAELQTRTGREAIEKYIVDNTGRTVELVPEVIGQAIIAVGAADPTGASAPETLIQKVYGEPTRDTGLQGRLFRGTKRLLGNKDVRRLMVFEHPFRLVALITPILLRIHKALTGVAGDVNDGCIGHPVNFEGRDEHRNQLALARLGEAYRHAGIKECRFYPEPIGAAVSYLHANPNADGEQVLTVDFGGGTLDFCVLKRDGPNHFHVVTTHGVALGGDQIDQRLFRELLFPLLGKGERWRRRGEKGEIDTIFPFEDYQELLVNWAVTYTLNQNRYTTPVLDCIGQGGEAKYKFRRLRDLIQHNYSYLVFQSIKAFKAKLSDVDEAVLDIPEIDVEVVLTRGEFEGLIADLLGRVESAVEETVHRG